MDLVIRDVPAPLIKNLDRKAKASGRTVAAEAKALLKQVLGDDNDLDDLQMLVSQYYNGKVPKGEADALIADRRLEAAAEDAKL